MANVNLYEVPFTPQYEIVEHKLGNSILLPEEATVVSSMATVVYYKMTGRDSACLTPTYHSWVTVGNPDFAAAQAGALPCGGPLVDIYIADSWT